MNENVHYEKSDRRNNKRHQKICAKQVVSPGKFCPCCINEIMAFEMTQCQGFNLTDYFPDQIIVVGVRDPDIH